MEVKLRKFRIYQTKGLLKKDLLGFLGTGNPLEFDKKENRLMIGLPLETKRTVILQYLYNSNNLYVSICSTDESLYIKQQGVFNIFICFSSYL